MTITICFLLTTVVGQSGSGNAEGEQKFATVIQGYIKEIEELKWVIIIHGK